MALVGSGVAAGAGPLTPPPVSAPPSFDRLTMNGFDRLTMNGSVEDWEFSWERRCPGGGCFRWRLEGAKWRCSRMAGQAEVIGSAGSRLTLRCALSIDESGFARVTPPGLRATLSEIGEGNGLGCASYGGEPEGVAATSIEGDHAAARSIEGDQEYGRWRICARVDEGDWRVRLEVPGLERLPEHKALQQGLLRYVKEIRGLLNAVWDDGEGHVHHVGFVSVKDGVAWLGC